MPQDIVFASDEYIEVEASDDEKPSSLQINAYTGGKLALRNFPHPVVIRTSNVKAMDKEQLPLLRDHDQKRAVGHGKPIIASDSLRIEGGFLSIAGEDRDSITAAVKNGFRWQASVGGRIPNIRRDVKTIAHGERFTVNGRSFVGPAHIINAFLWKETSFVALGADEGRASASVAAELDTQVQRKNPMNEFEKWLEASGFNSDELTDEQVAALKDKFEAADGGNVAASAEVDIERITAAAVAAAVESSRSETQRTNRIDRLFASYRDNGLEKEEFDKLRTDVEAGDISEDKAHLTLLQASRSRSTSNVAEANGGGIEPLVLEAAVAKTNGFVDEDIQASLVEAGASDEQVNAAMNQSDTARYRGANIKAIIAAACRQAGHSFYQIGDDEIRCALQHAYNRDRPSQIQAASGFSTVSLPGILSRLANKAMLAAYSEADGGGVALDIASVTSTGDFKKFNRYRMTEAGVMELVPASGEIPHGTLMEEEYENKVETYGKILALTRQMMRNDDLDAFLQIPRAIGRMGRHSLEQITIETLVNAPTNAGAGTTEFFHGAIRGNQEPNYAEGAATALSIDSLETAYELFLNQVDADGKPIGLDPSWILTTNADHVTARKLYNDIEYRFTQSDTKETINNQWKGMFRPLKSSYLHRLGTSPSATQWYMGTNPTLDISGIQVAFLDGNRTPTLDRAQTDFNTLGVQWRGYYDFGVALQDPRAIVKMKGAA